MNDFRWMRQVGMASLTAAAAFGSGIASAYTTPYSTPEGITLIDVSKLMDEASPQLLWRRLGDAKGNPLYTYDADQPGRSSCYGECATEFPPFVADAHARAAGDFTILTRDDHVHQWAYQGKPLYRFSGKDPEGEPKGSRFQLVESPAWHDPASNVFSPRAGWRRAAYMPEKSIVMPPNVDLDALGVANGFGFVDVATRMTIYAAPLSQKLSSAWQPLRASALALALGEFSVIKRKNDGTHQWTYHGEALYTYGGDYAPGEANGLSAGEKNVQVALAYRNFLPAGLIINQYPGRGPLLTNAKGMTLYSVARYELQYGGRESRTGYSISYNDLKEQGTTGCQGECTATWRPVSAPANAQGWGFWEPVARPDGSRQWAFKGSPVYSFAGDSRPGDIEGNNRHVVVYGGPQGEIIYASVSSGDTTGVHPKLGKIDLQAAVGPRFMGEDGIDFGNGGTRAKGAADPTAPRQTGRAAVDRRQGAGFYWHTVGLFY